MKTFDLDDYHFDMGIENLACCGIAEINGIQSDYSYYDADKADLLTPRFIVSVVKQDRPGEVPVIVFSVSNGEQNHTIGERLAKFIRKNKLGRVTSTPWKRNPNSGNDIKVFTWIVDWTHLNKFKGGK